MRLNGTIFFNVQPSHLSQAVVVFDKKKKMLSVPIMNLHCNLL